MTALRALLVLLTLALGGPASAEDGAALELAGSVLHPQRYTAESLAHLPASTEKVMFFTGHGPVLATFKGVALWQLVEAAGLATDPKDHDPSLRKILVATGADGYRVAMALAEIDPKFGGGQAMVAFEQDGKPLAGGFRFIVLGDKAGGRAVNRLVRLEISDIK